MSASGWYGVDLDGTLAHYGTWVDPTHIGEPVVPMLERVKRWISDGREVRIFTARVFPLGRIDPNQVLPMRYVQREQEATAAAQAIRVWCDKHIGRVLTITCVKDHHMACLYDDRCIQVRPNTGELVGTQDEEKS